jgi:hypothetical protein
MAARSMAGVTNTFSKPKLARLRHCALAFVALSALAGIMRAQSREATLEAIHCLENPGDSTSPGPCGELGAYQFRPATWHKYSQEPFHNALDRRSSDTVAIRHYEWLKQEIECHGLPPSAYNIALAWNGGLRAVLSGRSSRGMRDYAQRAANLAWSFDQAWEFAQTAR